jgi:hypothetical protein
MTSWRSSKKEGDLDLPEDKLFRINAVGLKVSTGGALLVDADGEEVWIPQSMIDDKSEVYREGDEGELVIPLDFAEKKGLV